MKLQLRGWQILKERIIEKMEQAEPANLWVLSKTKKNNLDKECRHNFTTQKEIKKGRIILTNRCKKCFGERIRQYRIYNQEEKWRLN